MDYINQIQRASFSKTTMSLNQKKMKMRKRTFHFRLIDDKQDEYVKRLADAVAIKSVSAWPDHRQHITTQVNEVAKVTGFSLLTQDLRSAIYL